MNPCKCGYLGDDKHICTCTDAQLRQYFSKFSGPMLDRIDMHIQVASVMQIDDGTSFHSSDASGPSHTEGHQQTVDHSQHNSSPVSTAAMRDAVQRAVGIQRTRYAGTGITSNGRLTETAIKKYCIMTPEAEAFMKDAFNKLGFSMRTYYKMLKVARTIADLDQEDHMVFNRQESDSYSMTGDPIRLKHIAEAIQYRSLDPFYRRGSDGQQK